MIEYLIRKATLEDVDSIDKIMRQYPEKLEWVQKTKIIKAIDSLLFSVVAFYGVLPISIVLSIFLSNMIIKYAVSILSAPIIYLVSEKE